MKKSIKSGELRIKNCGLFLILIFNFQLSIVNCLHSQAKSELYFNSGIDKYVKGDYDDAIALFEQTLSESPGHQKAKNFLVKVLIEATEKQIMLSNFPKAKIYIEKAKIISPDNPKADDLFKVVSGGYVKKKQEIQPTAKIKERTEKQSSSGPVEIKKEKQISAEKAVPADSSGEITEKLESEKNNLKNYLVVLIFILIVILFSGFVWLKRKASFDFKETEELKNKIRAEEEEKFKHELERIKQIKNEEFKKEITEKIKIQIAEQKIISGQDAETAQTRLAEIVEEGKIIDIVSGNLKKNQYSKQVIQKMVVSLRTIMNFNKSSALENIVRLSKSDNSRIRFDCVKIIEEILTPETFNILLSLLNDDNQEVKRTAIFTVKNIIKSAPSEISNKSILDAKSRLAEEQIKNGWII